MRPLTSMFTILALTFALGCASGDDGSLPDAGASAADSDLTPAPDAMPNTPPVTSGLGQVCDQTNTCTDQQATDCIAFSMTATSGVCTFECAIGLDEGVNPDAAANQACATAYTGTTGTPLCAAGSAPVAGKTSWSCLIACGTVQMTDLGECPGGLTCTDNTCQ